MKIITNPANEKYIEKYINKILPYDYTTFIKPVEVVYNKLMEKERKTGKYKVLQNDFFTYWDGKDKPSSWAIYFGFVVEETEPLFYIIENTKTFFDPFKLPIMWPTSPKFSLLNNFV